MFRLLLLLLFCTGTASGQHPSDRLEARLGPTLEPDEQAYFGLFYTLDARFHTATFAPQGDSLSAVLTLHEGPVLMDSTVILSVEASNLLARYVEEYETLFSGDGLVPRRRGYATLLRERIARPADVRQPGTRVRVVRRDGSVARGTLLWADTRSLGIHEGYGVFDWHRAGEVQVVSPSEVGRIELSGWPEGAVQAAQVATALAVQATAPLYDGAETPALDLLRVGSGAAAIVLLGERPRNRIVLQGQREAYAAALPRLTALSRFQTLRPPELAARAEPLDPPPFAPDPLPRVRRPYVSVMVTHAFEVPISDAFTVEARYAAANPQAESGAKQTEVRARARAAGLHGEVSVHVLPWLSLSGEAAHHRSATLDRGNDEAFGAITLYGASVRARRRVQRTRIGDAWLSAGVGARHVAASMRGTYLITAAALAAAPAPNIYDTYAADAARWQPVFHVGYDVFFARHASVYVEGDVAAPLTFTVEAREASFSNAAGRYTASMPRHRSRVAGARYRLGLRLHF